MFARISGRSVNGVITAPPSKSYTHRALICASLAGGMSRVVGPSLCDDFFATFKALTSLGITLSIAEGGVTVVGGGFKPRVGLINCDESGTTLRFIVGVVSLINQRLLITGGSSLLRRPIGELVRALNALGSKMLCSGDYPPVVSYGGFRGGDVVIRGDISSQFISSLLLISPLADEEVVIHVFSVESKPYVLMTLRTQELFGVRVKVLDSGDHLTFQVPKTRYRPTNFLVEGDWSSAAYFLVAGAISGYVRVGNIGLDSVQADKEVLNVLRDVGASVRAGGNWVEVSEGSLEGFNYDVSNSPDLLPTLAVLAALARGESVISGIGRCRFKESDRVEAVVTNLKRLGVSVRVSGDDLVVRGVERVKSGIVSSFGDHRVAMAFSLLSLRSEGSVVIEDPLCVGKSYPNFWDELNSLGVEVEISL